MICNNCISHNNKYAISYNSFKLYVAIILFFPTLWGILGSSAISLGQLFYTFAVLISGLLLIPNSIENLKFPRPYAILFSFITLSYAATLSINSIIDNGSLSFNDFTDVYRPISYFLSLYIGSALFRNPLSFGKIRFIIVIVLACAVFDIVKFSNLGAVILKLYTHLDRHTFNYMRFSGTFAYCYNYCYILLFALLCSLFCNINKKLFVSISLILIALTGSRSGLLAVCCTLILYNILEHTPIKAFKYFCYAIIIAVLAVIILISLNIPLVNDIIANIEKLLAAFSGTGDDGSLSTRNSQLDRVLANFKENPLWGRGPLKSVSAPIEIQLGYYLSSWGIVGTSLYLSLIGFSLYIAFYCKNHPGFIGKFSKANCIWILCSFIMGMSTRITDQIRVSQFFFLIQGLQWHIYSTEKGKRNLQYRNNNDNKNT